MEHSPQPTNSSSVPLGLGTSLHFLGSFFSQEEVDERDDAGDQWEKIVIGIECIQRQGENKVRGQQSRVTKLEVNLLLVTAIILNLGI